MPPCGEGTVHQTTRRNVLLFKRFKTEILASADGGRRFLNNKYKSLPVDVEKTAVEKQETVGLSLRLGDVSDEGGRTA